MGKNDEASHYEIYSVLLLPGERKPVIRHNSKSE